MIKQRYMLMGLFWLFGFSLMAMQPQVHEVASTRKKTVSFLTLILADCLTLSGSNLERKCKDLCKEIPDEFYQKILPVLNFLKKPVEEESFAAQNSQAYAELVKARIYNAQQIAVQPVQIQSPISSVLEPGIGNDSGLLRNQLPGVQPVRVRSPQRVSFSPVGEPEMSNVEAIRMLVSLEHGAMKRQVDLWHQQPWYEEVRDVFKFIVKLEFARMYRSENLPTIICEFVTAHPWAAGLYCQRAGFAIPIGIASSSLSSAHK